MRSLTRILMAALLSSAALAGAPPASFAADHRDAPRIDELSAADINDVYLFRVGGKLVLALTTNPLADRDFASSYSYSPDVLYRIAIDTTGDGATDRAIDFTFEERTSSGQAFTARFPDGTRVRGQATLGTTLRDDPPAPIVTTAGAIKVFAGLRDDPFFFDLVAFNRFVATGDLGQFERGEDSFAGFNTLAIVVEVPVGLVSGGASRFGVYGVTYEGRAARPNRQLDRMGNPVVNTALIPFDLKDEFNEAQPQNDARRFGPVYQAAFDTFNTPTANQRILASVLVPDTLKFDVRRADGFPNGRRLRDNVVDIELTLAAGTTVTDRVDRNDKTFPEGFPYLAEPHQTQGAD